MENYNYTIGYDTVVTTKDGTTYSAVLIDGHFEGWSFQKLLVDFGSCLSEVELSRYSFDERFDETYIEFLNRVLA